MDEMAAIKSETQRLIRETQVSIPYHKPKQHSLQEFMSRRNVTKPIEALKSANSTPRVKMSHEELELYAKKLEEKAKEAEQFFKAESDEEKDKEKEPEENQEKNENEATNTEPEQSSEEPKKTLDIDNLKKMLNIPKLSESPKLSGSSNMLIDLESGDVIPKKPTGVDKLFQRFLKSNGKLASPKTPKETTVKVLSAENGKLEMTTLNVSLSKDNTPKTKEPKPYEAYFKLKENLKTLIQRKRQEDFSKKVEESMIEEKERKMLCGDEDEDFEDDDEDEISRIKKENKTKEIYVNEDEEIEVIEENEDVEEDAEEIENPEAAEDLDEIEDPKETDDPEENEDQEESSESEEEDNETFENTKKNRIIKAFEDSDEDEDYIKTQKLTQFPYKSPKKAPEALFTPEENHSDVENELLEICSGQFTETQKDKIPMTQGQATEDELMELCSGTFATQAEPKEKLEILSVQVINPAQTQNQPHEDVQEEPKVVTRIVSSDDEVAESEKPDDRKMKKKKTKKRVKKLGFSDDEASSEEEVEEEEVEEPEEEIPETYIDYDSEENEVEVVMNKKEVAKVANNFVDNEAELSESEWGSADEDEKDMDKYDIELGDEENFDQAKLKKELEQIHMRNILNDDAKNIRKLQVKYFLVFNVILY